jgi:hypothetical protein
VQVSSDPTFGSVNIDANSQTNYTLFTNITTPANKDPYNNGDTIHFKSGTALSNGTTYYWHVRARDTGSYVYSPWSVQDSFTVDTSATTTSIWFQTMKDQFTTDILEGVTATSVGQAQLITGSTTGTTTSNEIDFSSGSLRGNAWGSLAWTNTKPATSTIVYHIQYLTSDAVTWANIPDIDLPSNGAGFTSSPVNLLGLDPVQYPVIRLAAVLNYGGGTPILSDWTLSWGYKVTTPTISKLFPNEKTSTTTPTFEFTTTDPQSDPLTYEVQWSTTYAFTSSTTRTSDTNLGFTDITQSTATDPYPSGDTIQFKIRAVDALTPTTTYWWRVHAKDPTGSNLYSDFTDPQSFTTDSLATTSTWFQTTAEQFAIDTLSGATTTGQSATVSSTSVESLVAYAEGNVQTPEYRTWNGSSWSAQKAAQTVNATINWVVTRAATTREEYIVGTLGTDNSVNMQVYTNGSWGNLKKVTSTIADATMRGFDIAYESVSGRAIAVSCTGTIKPSYWIWDGATWTNGGTINVVTPANNCGWIRLVPDPTTNNMIMVMRDTGGVRYEALVWNGTTWGSETAAGQMQNTQLAHEGMAGSWEDSGNQAVLAISNNTNNNFISLVWNGAAWSSSTVALTNDFDWGDLVRDKGTDNMALCYIDSTTNVGYVKALHGVVLLTSAPVTPSTAAQWTVRTAMVVRMMASLSWCIPTPLVRDIVPGTVRHSVDK